MLGIYSLTQTYLIEPLLNLNPSKNSDEAILNISKGKNFKKNIHFTSNYNCKLFFFHL